jgi:hypothetical protein
LVGTFGDLLVFRHGLLRDFLVADHLLGMMVLRADAVAEAWSLLAKSPDDRLRTSVASMILGSSFTSSEDREVALACRWKTKCEPPLSMHGPSTPRPQRPELVRAVGPSDKASPHRNSSHNSLTMCVLSLL